MEIPTKITCVECGGAANRMSYPPPDEGFQAGDAIAFVCADCGHRHDVVVDEDDDVSHSD